MVAARGSVVIWEVRRITAASLPQVVLFPLIDRFQREKRLIDLILFTVSGNSGQTVPGSHGSANAWPVVRSFLGALASPDRWSSWSYARCHCPAYYFGFQGQKVATW